MVLLLTLGVWQLQRRTAKLALIAQVERRLAAPPVPAPPTASRADAYRRVVLSGRFRHDRETRVKALTGHGAGFWLLTPLVGKDRTVLINRGFVPGQPVAIDRPTGPVTITGLLRLSEPGGGFLRANDPAANRWYSRDVAAIARARRLGPVEAYFVDAEPSANGYPVGGLTVVRFPNNHLVYALTWFALAALTLWAMAYLARHR